MILTLYSWIIDVKVIGIDLQHLKDLEPFFHTIVVYTTVTMLVKKFLISKLSHITKHDPVFYVVPVDNGIKVFELRIISCIEKDSACRCKLTFGVLVEILFIVLGLY